MVLAALGLLLAGCEGAGRTSTATVETTRSGIAPATWTLDPDVPIDSSSTELSVLVQRVECNSGRTGEVAAVDVEADTAQISIRIDVTPRSRGVGACTNNEQVAHVVRLDEPVGTRDLVDGTCAGSGISPKVLRCADPVRWSPPQD